MKKVAALLSIAILIAVLLSLLFYPQVSVVLGVISLLLSLALSTYTIYTKHKGTEHARAKILKEVGVMVLTLVLIIFLGGIAALLASAQVRVRWGEVAGLVSAIAAGFGVGYLVRKGVTRFVG